MDDPDPTTPDPGGNLFAIAFLFAFVAGGVIALTDWPVNLLGLLLMGIALILPLMRFIQGA